MRWLSGWSLTGVNSVIVRVSQHWDILEIAGYVTYVEPTVDGWWWGRIYYSRSAGVSCGGIKCIDGVPVGNESDCS